METVVSKKKVFAKRKSSHDENRRVPDVLPKLREAIDQLSPNPRNDYLKSVIFSKYADPSPGSANARKQAAIRKFRAVESNNHATNVRLMTVSEDFQILPRVTYARFMAKVLENVTTVIGEVPPGEIFGSFSGGASTSRCRTESHPALKYTGQAHTSYGFLESATEIVLSSHIWLDASGGLVPVDGNVLFTVPKSSDIDRCACKEPDINMYAQKFYGGVIRRELKKHKIDLNDQFRNQYLAFVGSYEGHLATLDLSSASDSISRELVFQALPICWFTALDACRSTSINIDGEWIESEMFSSMGNGFTFELESLLFYAITKAVAYFRGERGVISVYGDDIICPSAISDYLTYALSFLGFEVNTSKSFSDGPFRESCGSHFYDGHDITPFYVKGPVSRLLDLMNLLNSIRRWSGRIHHSILDDELSDFWFWASSYVPKRFWGGHDTNDRTRLVSYPASSGDRLTAITYRKENELGGYCHRLDGYGENQHVEDVERASESLSYRTIETGRYRSKPASWLGEPSTPFLREVCP